LRSALLPEDPSLVPYFGVIDRFLPASVPGQNDQLYHAQFEDGDGEEYFEDELWEVLALYDQLRGDTHNVPYTALLEGASGEAPTVGKGKGRAPQWTSEHVSVGARVCKFFAGVLPRNYNPEHAEAFLVNVVARPALSSGEVAVVSSDSAVPVSPASTIQLPAQPSVPAKDALGAQPQLRRSAILLEGSSLTPSGEATATVAEVRVAAAPAPRNTAGKARAASRPEPDHQLLKHNRPAEESAVSAPATASTAVVAEGAAPTIKKRKVPAVLDDEHSPAESPRGAPSRPASSSSGSGQGQMGGAPQRGLPAAGGQRLGPFITAPPRADRCVNPVNVPIVRFFDECLVVLSRHKTNIERARRRTFETQKVVPRDLAHKLVEDMAGDLIQSIKSHLDDTDER
jgi:hypothetical protein